MAEPSIQAVRVLSKKYDGSLRDEYPAFLHSVSNEQLVVFVPPGVPVIDHQRGDWVDSPDGLIEIYSRRAWYHVWHICEQVSGMNKTYVHIAMPAQYSGATIEWTDLDLDFRVTMDDSVTLLDEDEFQQNAARMRYPADVVEACWVACEQVRTGLRDRTGVFDRDHYVELYRRIEAARE